MLVYNSFFNTFFLRDSEYVRCKRLNTSFQYFFWEICGLSPLRSSFISMYVNHLQAFLTWQRMSPDVKGAKLTWIYLDLGILKTYILSFNVLQVLAINKCTIKSSRIKCWWESIIFKNVFWFGNISLRIKIVSSIKHAVLFVCLFVSQSACLSVCRFGIGRFVF